MPCTIDAIVDNLIFFAKDQEVRVVDFVSVCNHSFVVRDEAGY
jgi:hypothetical protein